VNRIDAAIATAVRRRVRLFRSAALTRVIAVAAALALAGAAAVAPSTPAQAADSGCVQIGSSVYFYTYVQIGIIEIGHMEQEWCPNGLSGSPREAVGKWTWGAARYSTDFIMQSTNEVWLENGPNTRTLLSSPLTKLANYSLNYQIDLLPFPKRVDVAVHLTYRHHTTAGYFLCEIYAAGVTHDYSTGNTTGGSGNRYC
jgi:hypothetical protein